MKTRIISSKMLIAITAVLFLVSSCDKNDDDDLKTIGGLITDEPTFSTLNTAVIKGGLSSKLNDTDQLTLLAPNNDAFTAAGITNTVLDGLSSNDVANILYYHIIPSKVLAADMPGGPNAKVLTFSGDSVFVTKNANGVFVNGINVSEADLAVSNGVVHKLSTGVLLPPSGNLLVAVAASGLDSLAKALNFAATGAGGDPTLVTTFSSALLTVFAPTNAAFTALLTALGLTDITQIPMATLIATLKLHVAAGRVFTSDLTNGNLSMISGGTTVVNLSNTSTGPTLSGPGNNTNTAKITKFNIVARNGVIHFIDKVLLP